MGWAKQATGMEIRALNNFTFSSLFRVYVWICIISGSQVGGKMLLSFKNVGGPKMWE